MERMKQIVAILHVQVVLCVGWSVMERECPTLVDQRIFAPSFKLPAVTLHRAYRTLPPGFSIRPSTVPGAGMGAFADTFLAKHTWLGDYQGHTFRRPPATCRRHPNSWNYSWVMPYQDHSLLNIDARHVNASNWLRWVNCARNVAELNVTPHQCYGKLLYKTCRDVAPGTELLTYYGDQYARVLGIDARGFHNRMLGRQLRKHMGLWYSRRLKAAA